MDARCETRGDHLSSRRSRVLGRVFGVVGAMAMALSLMGVSSVQKKGPLVWRDKFQSNTLDAAWNWLSEDTGGWSLTERNSFLRIYASPYATGGENLLLRSGGEGDFTIETRVLFEPTVNFQFAGLVIYQDGANYLQFGRAYANIPDGSLPGNGIYFDNIQDGGLVNGNFATETDVAGEAYLRLEVEGSDITASYSRDGKAWQEIGEHSLSPEFQVNGVGLTASQNYSDPYEAVAADFDYFSLTGNPKPWSPIDEEAVLINITGWWGTDFSVRSSENIVLRHGWAACTRGQVMAFVKALDATYLLDGEPLQGRWTAPEEVPVPSGSCAGGGHKGWVAHWEYSLGKLPPGEYTVHSTGVLTHPVTDGYRDGEGKPIFYEGTQFDADIFIHVDRLSLLVDYGGDAVEGVYEPGHSVTVTVTDADRNPKGSAVAFTEENALWGTDPGFHIGPSGDEPGPFDIEPGDWVSATVDNGVTTEVRIGEIQGTIDLETNTVRGTVAATWLLPDEVPITCMPWGGPEGASTVPTTVRPDGVAKYSCTWDPGEWDIQPGQVVGVGYSGPDGSFVANGIPVPTFVAYLPGAVEGYSWPMGHEITLTIQGKDFYAYSEQRPDFPEGETRVLFEGLSLQAGEYLLMTDETFGVTKDVVVANLAVTGISVGAGTVTGTCSEPCDDSLWVWLYDGDGQAPEIAGGTWVATFDELPPGEWGGATQWELDGDGTSIDFQVPVVQVPVVISVSTEEDVLADDGFCTLREAVIAANTNLPSGEAQGECPAGLDSMTDTIILAPDVRYSLTINNIEDPEDDGFSGDLDIRENQAAVDLILEVEGGGSASILQGSDRVLDILGASVEIKGLTLMGGNVLDSGGGVRNTGVLTFEAGTISGNVGTAGGGIYNEGTLTVEASTIADNTALQQGGGIYNSGMLIFDGVLSGNSATEHGGGLRNVGGATATIQNGANIYGNAAASGGGISNWGSLTVSASRIYENQATADVGGGIANYNPGVVTLDPGTSVHANSAKEGGGGVFNDVGGVLDCRGYIGQNSAASGGGLRNLGLATLNACGIEMNSAEDGGGIFNAVEGNLDVLAGNISLNSAAGGGGLQNLGGATLSGTWVDRNTATWAGGGISNLASGTLTVSWSTLADNTALKGGGISNSGQLVIQGVVLSRNSASEQGGGLFNDGSGTASVTDSAFLGDTSAGDGDAISSGVNIENATNVTASCIVGNGDAAVFNSSTALQNATSNWWGKPSGPTHPSNPLGMGDWVSDYIDFTDWLIEPLPICPSP